MAKPVNAAALKAAAPSGACGFDSRSGHYYYHHNGRMPAEVAVSASQSEGIRDVAPIWITSV
jgi:hypothetical protein